jgi:hypothetical protein
VPLRNICKRPLGSVGQQLLEGTAAAHGREGVTEEAAGGERVEVNKEGKRRGRQGESRRIKSQRGKSHVYIADEVRNRT